MFKSFLFAFVLILCSFFSCEVIGQNDSTFVTVSFKASEGYLVYNENYSDCKHIESGNKVALEGPIKSLRLVSKYYIDSRLIPVSPTKRSHQLVINQERIKNLNKNAKQSSFAHCFWDSNTFIITDSDADVLIDGKPVATTSFRTNLAKGNHTVTSYVEGEEKKQSFYVNNISYTENFIRPDRSTFFKKSLVPGLSQTIKGQNGKAYLFVGVLTAIGVNAAIYNKQMVKETNNYQKLKFQYLYANDPQEIFEIIEKSEKVYDKISRYKTIRNISLISLGAVYLANIWDGIQPPELGFRKQKINFNPYIDFDKDLIPKINLDLSF